MYPHNNIECNLTYICMVIIVLCHEFDNKAIGNCTCMAYEFISDGVSFKLLFENITLT